MKNKAHKTVPKRSSEILLEIVRNKNLKKGLTYRYILQILGDRAFGVEVDHMLYSLAAELSYSHVMLGC